MNVEQDTPFGIWLCFSYEGMVSIVGQPGGFISESSFDDVTINIHLGPFQVADNLRVFSK